MHLMYFQSHLYPCHKKPNYISIKTIIELKTEAKVGVAAAISTYQTRVVVMENQYYRGNSY